MPTGGRSGNNRGVEVGGGGRSQRPVTTCEAAISAARAQSSSTRLRARTASSNGGGGGAQQHHQRQHYPPPPGTPSIDPLTRRPAPQASFLSSPSPSAAGASVISTLTMTPMRKQFHKKRGAAFEESSAVNTRRLHTSESQPAPLSLARDTREYLITGPVAETSTTAAHEFVRLLLKQLQRNSDEERGGEAAADQATVRNLSDALAAEVAGHCGAQDTLASTTAGYFRDLLTTMPALLRERTRAMQDLQQRSQQSVSELEHALETTQKVLGHELDLSSQALEAAHSKTVDQTQELITMEERVASSARQEIEALAQADLVSAAYEKLQAEAGAQETEFAVDMACARTSIQRLHGKLDRALQDLGEAEEIKRDLAAVESKLAGQRGAIEGANARVKSLEPSLLASRKANKIMFAKIRNSEKIQEGMQIVIDVAKKEHKKLEELEYKVEVSAMKIVELEERLTQAQNEAIVLKAWKARQEASGEGSEEAEALQKLYDDNQGFQAQIGKLEKEIKLLQGRLRKKEGPWLKQIEEKDVKLSVLRNDLDSANEMRLRLTLDVTTLKQRASKAELAVAAVRKALLPVQSFMDLTSRSYREVQRDVYSELNRYDDSLTDWKEEIIDRLREAEEEASELELRHRAALVEAKRGDGSAQRLRELTRSTTLQAKVLSRKVKVARRMHDSLRSDTKNSLSEFKDYSRRVHQKLIGAMSAAAAQNAVLNNNANAGAAAAGGGGGGGGGSEEQAGAPLFTMDSSLGSGDQFAVSIAAFDSEDSSGLQQEQLLGISAGSSGVAGHRVGVKAVGDGSAEEGLRERLLSVDALNPWPDDIDNDATAVTTAAARGGASKPNSESDELLGIITQLENRMSFIEDPRSGGGGKKEEDEVGGDDKEGGAKESQADDARSTTPLAPSSREQARQVSRGESREASRGCISSQDGLKEAALLPSPSPFEWGLFTLDESSGAGGDSSAAPSPEKEGAGAFGASDDGSIVAAADRDGGSGASIVERMKLRLDSADSRADNQRLAAQRQLQEQQQQQQRRDRGNHGEQPNRGCGAAVWLTEDAPVNVGAVNAGTQEQKAPVALDREDRRNSRSRAADAVPPAALPSNKRHAYQSVPRRKPPTMTIRASNSAAAGSPQGQQAPSTATTVCMKVANNDGAKFDLLPQRVRVPPGETLFGGEVSFQSGTCRQKLRTTRTAPCPPRGRDEASPQPQHRMLGGGGVAAFAPASMTVGATKHPHGGLATAEEVASLSGSACAAANVGGETLAAMAARFQHMLQAALRRQQQAHDASNKSVAERVTSLQKRIQAAEVAMKFQRASSMGMMKRAKAAEAKVEAAAAGETPAAPRNPFARKIASLKSKSAVPNDEDTSGSSTAVAGEAGGEAATGGGGGGEKDAKAIEEDQVAAVTSANSKDEGPTDGGELHVHGISVICRPSSRQAASAGRKSRFPSRDEDPLGDDGADERDVQFDLADPWLDRDSSWLPPVMKGLSLQRGGASRTKTAPAASLDDKDTSFHAQLSRKTAKEHEDLLSILHPDKASVCYARHKPKPVVWLLRIIRTVYDDRYALEVDDWNKPDDAELPLMRQFVVEWAERRYGVKKLVKQFLKDLVVALSSFCDHSLEIDTFRRFVHEDYRAEDLSIFLQSRKFVIESSAVKITTDRQQVHYSTKQRPAKPEYDTVILSGTASANASAAQVCEPVMITLTSALNVVDRVLRVLPPRFLLGLLRRLSALCDPPAWFDTEPRRQQDFMVAAQMDTAAANSPFFVEPGTAGDVIADTGGAFAAGRAPSRGRSAGRPRSRALSGSRPGSRAMTPGDVRLSTPPASRGATGRNARALDAVETASFVPIPGRTMENSSGLLAVGEDEQRQAAAEFWQLLLDTACTVEPAVEGPPERIVRVLCAQRFLHLCVREFRSAQRHFRQRMRLWMRRASAQAASTPQVALAALTSGGGGLDGTTPSGDRDGGGRGRPKSRSQLITCLRKELFTRVASTVAPHWHPRVIETIFDQGRLETRRINESSAARPGSRGVGTAGNNSTVATNILLALSCQYYACSYLLPPEVTDKLSLRLPVSASVRPAADRDRDRNRGEGKRDNKKNSKKR